LNPVTSGENSFITGTEIYHEPCYKNKVMGKALKYAKQIKALEPEQIVAQLYGSDKFNLTDDEIKIVKSNKSASPDSPIIPANIKEFFTPEFIEFMGKTNGTSAKSGNYTTISNEFIEFMGKTNAEIAKGGNYSNIPNGFDVNYLSSYLSYLSANQLGQDEFKDFLTNGFDIESNLNVIYDTMSSNPYFANIYPDAYKIFNKLSKEELKDLIDTTAQVALSNDNFLNLTLEKTNGYLNPEPILNNINSELQEQMKNVLLDKLPQELKLKLENLKNQGELPVSIPDTDENANGSAKINIFSDLDTESDTNSESDTEL